MANLNGLPVGTKVVIYDHYGSVRSKAVVESVTKGGNYKLSGSDGVWTPGGRKRGSDAWSHEYFDLFDQEVWDRLVAERKERNDRATLAVVDFKSLPIDVVRSLLTVIAAHKVVEG